MRRLILNLSLLVATAGLGQAQEDSAATRWPEIGSRVRVWTPGRTVTGSLVEIRGDTLVIRTGDERSLHLRRMELILAPEVTRIEVSRARGVQVRRVAGGAVIGVGVAVATVFIAQALLDHGDWELSPSYGKAAAVGGVVGALIGTQPSDRWKEAPVPRTSGFAPTKSLFGPARFFR